MYGSGGRLLSGIPINDIGTITRRDVESMEAALPPITVMPFGKYKGEEIANIPTGYRRWMIDNFKWDGGNQRLRTAILASLNS